jgi:hypothetical protein
LKNPKLAPGRSTWYRYYAGYSLDFARDAAESLDLSADRRALDPWSGSGTTVLAFAESGISCIGIDANPALVIVGRGRLLPASVRQSLDPIANGVLEVAQATEYQLEDDPLETWFVQPTAARLRRIEWALQHLLVSHVDYVPMRTSPRMAQLSNLGAFYYVALFEVVRQLVRPFRSSNPTWVKKPSLNARIDQSWDQLGSLFTDTVARLSGGLARSSVATARARVLQGDSTNLQLADGSIDGVLGSPPYCTRIDYIVSTLPELAVLGMTVPDVRSLRDLMIGTPTIHSSDRDIPAAWGPTATKAMKAIAIHPSRASSSYYRATYWQYFDKLARSIVEIRRVLCSGGKAILVVQDSHYKELRIDLARIVSEMGSAVGLEESSRSEFLGRSTWTTLNPNAARLAGSSPVESVLVLDG